MKESTTRYTGEAGSAGSPGLFGVDGEQLVSEGDMYPCLQSDSTIVR